MSYIKFIVCVIILVAIGIGFFKTYCSVITNRKAPTSVRYLFLFGILDIVIPIIALIVDLLVGTHFANEIKTMIMEDPLMWMGIVGVITFFFIQRMKKVESTTIYQEEFWKRFKKYRAYKPKREESED